MVKRLRREVAVVTRETGVSVEESPFLSPDSATYACVERFLPLPAEPTRELHWDLPDDWDGELEVDLVLVRGARIKPVVSVPEERAAALDPEALRTRILTLGATYCRAPLITVRRKRTTRDERHAADLPLEESLKIFAKECRVKDPDDLVAFAAALAREADAGGTT